MEITLNKKLLLVASCLLLVACAGETRAQQEHASKERVVTANLSLEEKCNQLSKETGKDYQVVSGQVTETGILPQPAVDCFKAPCSELMKTSFFAKMSSLDENEQGVHQNFSVYTPKESIDELERQNPYFQKGKRYKFCAYKADLSHLKIYDLRYGIDHPQAIEEDK